jgi:hypothetical protein
MSLRGRPVEETATLPDGRLVMVWIGVLKDPYVASDEIDTVTLEVRIDGQAVATLKTVLDPDDEGEARELGREIVAGLTSGQLEPTAGALEPLATRLR